MPASQTLGNSVMKPATLAVHAGSRPDREAGGLNTPVHTSSAFDYLDRDVRYPRYFNTPNELAVCAKLAALEGADSALLFSSGMAALATLFTGLLQRGDHALLLEGIYGGTHSFILHEFERLGIAYDFWDGDAGAIQARLTPETRLIFVESPTNPLLRVVDLAAVAEVARDRGILTAIDNTFASPVLQQPLSLGFDLVMHSATKYLGGHSDLCLGVLAGSGEMIKRLRPQAIRLGGSTNAEQAAALERRLKTLVLRVQRQSENAAVIARWLADHDRVSRVHYPGLPDHPGHAVAARQMLSFGGMLSFEINEDMDPTAFQRRLSLITPAVSLGGVETTICQPVLTSHAKMTAAERQRLGITEQLLRLSVGIEDAGDLIDDLDQALMT